MSNKQRAVLLGLAALTVVVAVIFGATNGGGNEDENVIDSRTEAAVEQPVTDPAEATPTTTATTEEPKPKPDTTIVFRDGESVEGVEKLRFRKGSTISFTVKSDVAEDVHLHGYDVSMQVEAGGTVRFSVPAEVEGRFELEMEHSAKEIARIEVVP